MVWDVVSDLLFTVSVVHSVRIHAFVLMPNHFHLILSTPDRNLDAAMGYLIREASRTLNRVSGRQGHLFGGKYFWSLMDSPPYYVNAVKYVYRNPVKAGITEKVEDYPYSTISCLAGNHRLTFPLFAPMNIAWETAHSDRITEFVGWLNRPYPDPTQEALRKGLRKPRFHLPLDRSSRRRIELESF